MVSPLFTLTASSADAGFGADAATGAGMDAVMSNPYTAAAAALAAAGAYAFSPSVRHAVNPMIKSGYESITNPFQHFGDGSSKDKFGNLMGGFGQLDPGIHDGIPPGQLDPGMSNTIPQTSLSEQLQKALKNMGQNQNQQKQQTSLGSGGFSDGITAPNEIPYINQTYQYAPPSPLNPIPPLFMSGGKYGGGY